MVCSTNNIIKCSPKRYHDLRGSLRHAELDSSGKINCVLWLCRLPAGTDHKVNENGLHSPTPKLSPALREDKHHSFRLPKQASWR
ncbi:unnamed protein product, partial [Protopolystoma xenopodis]